MTDYTRPISASNPPESRGTRGTLLGDIIVNNTDTEPSGKPPKAKASDKAKTRTVDVGANPK